MKKHVVVLSTGGTIASTRSASGRSASGALKGEALVDMLALPPGIQVHVDSVLQKPSNAITATDLLLIRNRCIEWAGHKETCGIVITHGTDTLEDTAFFLQSTLPADFCTTVVTGSQRVPHAQGSDALTNLTSAITVAAHPDARGNGVLVVFNETVFSASTVRKVNSFQVNGFAAPGYGCLGYVDGTSVHLLQRARFLQPITPGPTLPRVDLLPVALDADAALVRAAIDSGAQGLVLDGVGRGHVPPGWMPVLEHAATTRQLPIVITTSCLQGALAQAYEFVGSLFSLERIGVVVAQDLSARKARMRLMAFLSSKTPDLPLSALFSSWSDQPQTTTTPHAT